MAEPAHDPAARPRRPNWRSVRYTPPGDADGGHWLVTYSDTVTLLLTIFVVLVSMMTFVKSTPEPLQPVLLRPVFVPVLTADGELPSDILEQDSAPPASRPAVAPPPPPNAAAESQSIAGISRAHASVAPEEPGLPDTPQTWASRTSRELAALLAREGLGRNAVVERVDRHVVVRLGDNILFGLGQAELRPEGAALMARLAPSLARLHSFIRVEGHTDDLPIATARYPSNWELSAGRAATVVRHLIAGGMPGTQLEAVGFADSRPVMRGHSAAARARNRRVSFVILPPDGLP
ncbi:flagellar motor protein MotB [Ferrovibrio sp.]|uniref:OmpA/MotB family protein n=1 Tax=Ferrovibrio sp. TaxID=1917215 RepID=UPI002635FC04|nr:flagellar motor protein MotB [Ferrovibrio sp.]